MKQTCIEQWLRVILCDICCSKSIVKITVGRRSVLYVLKFTNVLKTCHKFTVCNNVMFYVNLFSVFLKSTINKWFPSASQNILLCMFTVVSWLQMVVFHLQGTIYLYISYVMTWIMECLVSQQTLCYIHYSISVEAFTALRPSSFTITRHTSHDLTVMRVAASVEKTPYYIL